MSADYDLHLDVTSKSRTLKTNSKVRRMNVHVKSKFSECSDFSCYRSNGTLEPMTSSFPAESESLRANPSQAHMSSQLGLSGHVRFPQLEFRAENPVITSCRLLDNVNGKHIA